jgi:hypothetical protein
VTGQFRSDAALVVGIDPGKQGGVVALDLLSQVVLAERVPWIGAGRSACIDVDRVAEWLDQGDARRRVVVALEKAGPRQGKGVGAERSGAEQYATLATLARLRRWQLWEIRAEDWSREVLHGMSRDSYEQRKASAVARASRLWPSLSFRTKADWGMADAALIAEYTRRRFLGRHLRAS